MLCFGIVLWVFCSFVLIFVLVFYCVCMDFKVRENIKLDGSVTGGVDNEGHQGF